ncbi:SDR family NAD(P)-dependent oxidoreductase [Ewingella sp. AOP8-B2-18]
MKLDLTDKIAVVSGSTSGIGLGIASGLAQAGATVVIVSRHQQGVDAAVATIIRHQPDARLQSVVADLTTEQGAKTLFAAVPEADVLVNNLGIYNDVDFFAVEDDEWARFYDVNVVSGVRLSRHYASGMVEKGWGRVIFISSESGVAIPADMINYGVTKSANLAVSHGLAKRLAGTGVTVNAILPGPTYTEGLGDMLADAAEQSGRTRREQADEFVKVSRPSSIIQRAAEVGEVANLVVYIASSLSSATTGAALRVDGGVVDTLAM